MRRLSFSPIVLSLTVATGCNPNTPQHTSEYYFQHPQEANQRVAACDKLSLADRDADCANAANGSMEYTMHGRGGIGNPTK